MAMCRTGNKSRNFGVCAVVAGVRVQGGLHGSKIQSSVGVGLCGRNRRRSGFVDLGEAETSRPDEIQSRYEWTERSPAGPERREKGGPGGLLTGHQGFAPGWQFL